MIDTPAISKQVLPQSPCKRKAFFEPLHLYWNLADPQGNFSSLQLSPLESLQKRVAIHLNNQEESPSRKQMRDYLDKISRLYELYSPDPPQKSVSPLPLKESITETPEDFLIEIQTPKARGRSMSEPSSKEIQRLTSDSQEKAKVLEISSLARLIAIFQQQKNSSCTNELQGEEGRLLAPFGAGPIKLDDIPQKLPEKFKITYWKEVLLLLHDPLLIWNLAKGYLNNTHLKSFPELHHIFIFQAAQILLRRACFKVSFDPHVFELLYEPRSVPPRHTVDLHRAITHMNIYCYLATQPQKDQASFLEKQLQKIANDYALSKSELQEDSKNKIMSLLKSSHFSLSLSQLKKSLRPLRNAFEVEALVLLFHRTVYGLLDQINTINLSLLPPEKASHKIVVGEDEILPLSVFIIHMVNDPALYGIFSFLEDCPDHFLEFHARHIFAGMIGSCLCAQSELKQAFESHPDILHRSKKPLREGCFPPFFSISK